MAKLKYKKTIIGKFVLDSVAIGMYNHPLMLLREYIQNSADSIDELCIRNGTNRNRAKIGINIDGINRSVTVKDNGLGIPARKAWSTLHDVGKSLKKPTVSRGFRGIGRLGGLGYCDKLRFITKAKGERKYSISIWDCKQLRRMINDVSGPQDALSTIKKITEFKQPKYTKNINDHFLIVEMLNVKSSKDVLLDVPAIKSYLSQVAPVPFDYSTFSYAGKIEKALKSRISLYKTYKIYVNGEQIFKPYRNVFHVNKKDKDQIRDVEFVELADDGNLLAFGWIARLQLLGAMSCSDSMSGIRLRSGNILVGDKNSLSDFYIEKRFNSYLVGEIHTAESRFILNSRRDGFEDSEYKEKFYNCFVKEIGIPWSRKIREASRLRSKNKSEAVQNNLIVRTKKIIDKGFVSRLQRKGIMSELKRVVEDKRNNINKEQIDFLIKNIHKSEHFLDQNHKKISRREKRILKAIFNIIYRTCKSKLEAENIINKITKL